MTNAYLTFRLLLLSTFVYLITACTSLVFDINALDQSKIEGFDLSDETIKYYRNIIILRTSNENLRIGNWYTCGNDKILLTDKYLHLLENPGLSDLPGNISMCDFSSIRPEKYWKIKYGDIIKIEEASGYNKENYKLYISNSDSSTDHVFIKIFEPDVKLFNDILLEHGILIIHVSTLLDATEAEHETFWLHEGCGRLSEHWEEYGGFSFFGGNNILHPPFWQSAECISKTGYWSEDGEKANTIDDANDQKILYTEKSDKNYYCSPYTSSWVSTENYLVDTCKGSWTQINGKNDVKCDQPNMVQLKRLAIGGHGCYLYGERTNDFIKRVSP